MIHKQMQIENKSLSDNCYCLSESLEPFKSNISDFSTNNENVINDNLNERHYITKNSELLVKSSSLELNQGFSYKEIQEIQTKKPEENKETNSYQYEKSIHMCIFPECFKSFKDKGNLYKIRPFKCNFPGCIRTFTTSGNLKLHQNVHKKDGYKFKCDLCDKSYYVKARLEIHKRTHNGEKPYKCPVEACQKQFNEKGILKTHIRVHTGERPYKCDIANCDKRFKTLTHLKNHKESHKKH